VHPFNLQNKGEKKYSEWEFERGADTLKHYVGTSCTRDEDDMLKGKHILDVGAGACGKSVYYLTRGAAHVSAIDVIAEYKDEAEELAERFGVRGRFDYTTGDAADMPFDNNTFDAVIMNDAMEHVQKPERVLDEIYRVLKPSGRLYINFPPYLHPYGAHLTDTIAIPWVHLFCKEETLINAYKSLVSALPDRDARISFRISKNTDGKEYFSYINKMTVKRFNTICKGTKLKRVYYREIPLRTFLTPLAKFTPTKEAFVRCVVCVLEK
ncbi:MAG: class I SAM-dependent methyltransferase, partial [Clostridia bacterium]|nr:class I SAM-dependent methyltransferase [Clostridia bacterium]